MIATESMWPGLGDVGYSSARADLQKEREREQIMTEDFDEELLYRRIDTLTPAELDSLPRGAIQLDASGRILQYNAFEAKLANLKAQNVIGRNFFTEVAPCTNVREFHGRFLEGVQQKKLHEKFRYQFSFKPVPRNVLITLFYSDATDTVWVFVRPIGDGVPTVA